MDHISMFCRKVMFSYLSLLIEWLYGMETKIGKRNCKVFPFLIRLEKSARFVFFLQKSLSGSNILWKPLNFISFFAKTIRIIYSLRLDKKCWWENKGKSWAPESYHIQWHISLSQPSLFPKYHSPTPMPQIRGPIPSSPFFFFFSL